MHLLFADWHREVEIEPTAEVLTARWATIDQLVTDGLTTGSAVGLVALAHEQDHGDATSFAAKFKEAEPTFPMVGNRRLLAVLAGACVIHALEGRDEVADLAAYAVVATGLTGSRPTVEAVGAESSRYLAEEAVRVRTTAEPPEPLGKFSGAAKGVKDADLATGSHPNFASPEKVGQVVTNLVTQINQQTNTAARYAEDLARWAESSMRGLREELNMLWWLLSARSRSTGAAWADMAAAGAAVAGARELATLVELIPAPAVVDELLRQLLDVSCSSPQEPVDLAAVVAALPAGVQVPRPPEVVAHLAPVTAAAAGSSAAAGDQQPPHIWAARAFTEAMLMRAVDALETVA